MSIQPLQSYPLQINDDIDDVTGVLTKVSQVRKQDQKQWLDLPNQFLAGRSVNKIPATSTDISGSRVGDFNVTSSYAYFCVDNGGTAEWVRIAVATF